MKKNYLNFKSAFVVLLFFVCFSAISQTTTVFSDDFNVSQGIYYTTGNDVFIGSSPTWKLTRTGNDLGAAITNDRLYLSNDATTASNTTGWALGSVNLVDPAFTPYSAVLKDNPGMVTWTFNMRQNKGNPNGFSGTVYGMAFVLAGTNGLTNASGSGYAVVLGNSGKTDPIRLVKFTNGLASSTTLVSSSTSGLTDLNTQYLSIKVTYVPATNTWQLYARNDSTTASVDPTSGTLTSQGTAVDNTYTSATLPLTGPFVYAGKVNVITALYDNVKITVGVPFISTLSPTAAFAGDAGFTLTVNGQNFVAGSKVRWNGVDRVTTYVSATQLTAVIPASDIVAVGTASVTVVNGTTSSNTKIFTITSAGTPTLTVVPESLNLPTTVTGDAMTPSSYTVKGVNLTADPVVTAPANFEIALTSGGTYSSSLSLARTGNVLTTQPTTIYIKKTVLAPAGVYSVAVTHATTGGAVEELAVTAIVLATKPTTQASGLTFTNVTSTSVKANWTNGNGERRLLVIKQGSAVTTLAVNGETYTGSTVFGSGSELGTGNFVAYSGTGTSVTVTGLTPATFYHIALVEYNGTAGTENYLTTGNLIGNQKTLNAPLGMQIYANNTVNAIDFDTTVDGVNEDSFQANGFAPGSESGQLDSNAWAFSGFSSSDVNYGGTSPEDSSYDNGPSVGGVTDGGIYAFEIGPDNFSLGVQPTGPDFTPGTITLKIQNQTGATITSLNVGYKVFVYNDQASSASFNFSHLNAATGTYTTVAALDVVSPTTADAVAQWKGYYRVTTLAVSIPTNSYYYLRWSGGTAGTGSYDEFALDDIVVVANPTSTFAPFSGTASSFVVNGNAQLSGDLQVDTNLTFSNSAKLNIGATTLSLKGTLTNTTANGIKGSASSNLIINGNTNVSLSLDQTIVGTTNLFNALTIASTAANTATLLNAVAVNGTLTVAENQLLDLGTNVLTGTLSSAVVNGSLLTKNTTTSPLPSGTTWSGSGIVDYNSVTTAQTVVAGTYNGLTVRPTAGATPSGNLVVNGILNLPSGNPSATVGSLHMGSSYTLTMGGAGTNTGTGDVTGVILRNSIVPNVLYTFGHKDTSILFPNEGTLPSAMGLKIEIGTAPSWKTSGVKRIYDFKQTGGTGTEAVIKGHYLDSELNGNNESRLVDYVNRSVAPIGTFEQGRSNYNTTENWIELTNADVAVAFFADFDIVKLGFAETAVAFATWTGATSDSWITTTNWSPATVPSLTTTVVIPNGATTSNDPMIVSGAEVLKMTIEAGGIVNAPTNAQFTVYGGAGAWLNNGTFNPGGGTSTVTFLHLEATIAGSTTFNNITIESGAGLRPLTDNVLSIVGTFTKTGNFTPEATVNTVIFTGTNQVVPALTSGIQAYNNLTISGTGAVFPTSLNISGNLSLNNSVDFSGKTVVMTGVSPQTIGGTAATFNHLTINNSNGGVSLVNNSTVNGTLTLSSGQLKLGNNHLTLGTTAVAGTFSATKMIVTDGTGEVRKPFSGVGSYVFPVGEATTPAYSPMTVNVTSGTFASAYVGVSVKDGVHPNNYSVQNNLSRYWTVSQSGITDAIATVTGTYLTEDLSAAVGTIAAAQLKGTFNAVSNPWLKLDALSGTTLTAAAASLTSGQTSVFTGIKAATFSTVVSGYGSFCKDDLVTLTAGTMGGDAPFTYLWNNGLGTAATAVPPTATFGTVNYSVTVRDANGAVATDTAAVTVLATAAAGSVSASQTICKGAKPTDITLTGVTGDVLYWQKSTDATFAVGTTNISNITTVLQGVQAGPVLATTYYRAVISNGDCGVVYSPSTSAALSSTTWDGMAWSNGVPTATMSAIIEGDFTINAAMTVCSLTISEDADVVVSSGITLIVDGALTITTGSLVLEDTASLLQNDDLAQNTGAAFTMKRQTTPISLYDYTYWSSPVANWSLHSLSPNTHQYKYMGWNSATQAWVVHAQGTQIMAPGVGYIVRAPQSFSADPSVEVSFEGKFTGVPNNGIIEVAVVGEEKYNFLGNPYPSALSADAFLEENASVLGGTIYLWTHNTPFNGGTTPTYSYATSDYASYNLLGGTGTAAAESIESPGVSDIPNGAIASGQGFFIKGGLVAGTAVFNNAMRLEDANDQFFRTASSSVNDKSRIWLNLSNLNGSFKQVLIGYTSNATTGFDKGWDGELFSSSAFTFYTFAAAKKLSIQGLPLPFNAQNGVPLGFNTTYAGNHRIALDNFDGLFDNQAIYLYDHLLETVHNIKAAPYDFVSAIGTFDSRFEVVYSTPLGIDPVDAQHLFYVYKEKNAVVVKSPAVAIKSIQLIDMQGRIIQTVSDVNALEVAIDLNVAQQVIVVSITTVDGVVVKKKLIY